jgi:NAD-dependent SIR2 family protein deacetylase
MSITVTCTECGTRLDAEWIRALRRGQPFVCPECGRSLVETGYVEVIGDDAGVRDPGAEAGAGSEQAA